MSYPDIQYVSHNHSELLKLKLNISLCSALRVFSAGDCVRCLSIYQKHDNVLQYKESKCMMDHMRNYEDLCWSISVDEPLLARS